MKKKTKKPKTLQQFLIPILRKASIRWPARYEALKQAREKHENGLYKNGNVRYITKYRCQNPACNALVNESEGQVDHRIAVAAFSGFTTFDDYINRLFCSVENLIFICTTCHKAKSSLEAQTRAENKKNKFQKICKKS